MLNNTEVQKDTQDHSEESSSEQIEEKIEINCNSYNKTPHNEIQKNIQINQWVIDHIPVLHSNITPAEFNCLKIWKFPPEFCQSRLAGRRMGSNACTIIALKMAEQIKSKRLLFSHSIPELDRKIVGALAEAILDGNSIHAKEVRRRKLTPDKLNFTIPDAIVACDRIFEELDYHADRGSLHRSLLRHMLAAIAYWERRQQTLNPPIQGDFRTSDEQRSQDLFLLLIADERTVLVIFHPKPFSTLALVDSHSHVPNGAVVCTAHIQHAATFCKWIARYLFPDPKYGSATGYEISMLVHKDEYHNNLKTKVKNLLKPAQPLSSQYPNTSHIKNQLSNQKWFSSIGGVSRKLKLFDHYDHNQTITIPLVDPLKLIELHAGGGSHLAKAHHKQSASFPLSLKKKSHRYKSRKTPYNDRTDGTDPKPSGASSTRLMSCLNPPPSINLTCSTKCSNDSCGRMRYHHVQPTNSEYHSLNRKRSQSCHLPMDCTEYVEPCQQDQSVSDCQIGTCYEDYQHDQNNNCQPRYHTRSAKIRKQQLQDEHS